MAKKQRWTHPQAACRVQRCRTLTDVASSDLFHVPSQCVCQGHIHKQSPLSSVDSSSSSLHSGAGWHNAGHVGVLSPYFRDVWMSSNIKLSGNFSQLTPTPFPILPLQRRETEAPAEPLAPGCRNEKEGWEGRKCLGCVPAPHTLSPSGSSWSSVLWNVTGACRDIVERLLCKPLTPHPGQSCAGSSSWAFLEVHGCPTVDRKQAVISLLLKTFVPLTKGLRSLCPHGVLFLPLHGGEPWAPRSKNPVLKPFL